MSEDPNRGRGRLSRRGALALAAAMLAIGIGVGAAIGPAPSVSFAGASPALLARLPALLASIAARAESTRHSAPASTEAAAPAEEEASTSALAQPPASAAEATSQTAGEEKTPVASKKPAAKKLPAISSVWLIELAGESFSQARSQAADAPYITGTLLHEGTLLGGLSALQGSALASEAALLAPVSEGQPPALVRSIVQPPCPEGEAGTSCSTPAGALSAADTFLKETLAPITSTAAYREHGLVVITFATVGLAGQEGLPAGASSATLTDTPPAGVLVLSPFAKAGSRPSLRFNPTSPRQSLVALLG